MKYAHTRAMHNLEKGCFETAGPYEIPIIAPEMYKPLEFIDFNRAVSEKKREGRAVHFFIHDYRFERIWTNLRRYGEMLMSYEASMSPDFSLYADWPTAVQIWNHYRKHYVGAYLQSLGIKVYPTICWSDEHSFDWCFDGEPVGGCVAVSSVGTRATADSKRLFCLGYDAMLERLKPETIIFYGDVPGECRGKIVQVPAFQTKFR